ncbi:MAG: hypothetical protein HY814_05505 [Candidatus Riflebacteria bacterium]|nr:hypothetical protein [Candidatus Riflebacteria bacterium]
MNRAGSTFDDIPAGVHIYLDANVFIGHFAKGNARCMRLLERSEHGEIEATTSIVTVLEVTHRLMLVEAIVKGLVSAPKAVAKLKQHPELALRLVAWLPLRGTGSHHGGLRGMIEAHMRSVTLKVDIPENRRLEVQLPKDMETGPAELAVIVLSPETGGQPGKPYGWLRYCIENAVDLERDDFSENVEEFTGRKF